MRPLRLAFAGTPEFARVALAALHDAGYQVPLVLTQPDRPAGRGLKLQASPVKQFALEHGMVVAQPRSLRLDGKFPDDARSAQNLLAASGLDAMVVAAYGLILPQWVLDAPRLGCFNIHASSLPRWRGAAPIHRAIEAGDASTGVTIMQMDAGLDTGDMLLAQALPILPTDTTGSLHDKLAELGRSDGTNAAAAAVRPNCCAAPAHRRHYLCQQSRQVRGDDPLGPVRRIDRAARACVQPGIRWRTPALPGETLRVWAAIVSPEMPLAGLPEFGTIVAVAHDGIVVSAIDSVVLLTELQRPGGKRLPIEGGFDLGTREGLTCSCGHGRPEN